MAITDFLDVFFRKMLQMRADNHVNDWIRNRARQFRPPVGNSGVAPALVLGKPLQENFLDRRSLYVWRVRWVLNCSIENRFDTDVPLQVDRPGELSRDRADFGRARARQNLL